MAAHAVGVRRSSSAASGLGEKRARLRRAGYPPADATAIGSGVQAVIH